MPAIFISHSSRDTKVSDDIKAWLAAPPRRFERVFLDFDKDTGIGTGDDWEKRLYTEIGRCHAVILVLTPNWFASKWCFAEFTQARALGKVILQVICAPLGKHKIPAQVQAVNLIDWNPDGLERIEKRLHEIMDELARGFSLSANRPPYPGIHAFEAEDAAIYFGRDEETREVIEKLDARRIHGGARLLLIVGASGAGKSSLLKAGVLPQLAQRERHWIALPPVRPESAPLEALAKAIAQRAGTAAAWEGWLRKLKGPRAVKEIAKLARLLRIGNASAATLLLPIDQFEEVFTIAEAGERAAFLALLAATLDPKFHLPVMAVATGRADVLQGLLEGSVLAALTETTSLPPMPLDRVPRLIEGPAEVVSLAIERGLADRIMREVESPEALPLLAYTLQLLHARCKEHKRLTVAEYLALGDADRKFNPIQNSVRRAADQAIAGLKPSEEELSALRDAFVTHLVRLRLDDAKRVRQPAWIADLRKADLRESERPLRALVEARLLSVRVNAHGTDKAEWSGEAVVEVAHEALFVAWPMLKAWLDEDQDFLADVARLKGAHETWEKVSERDKPQALLRGLLLNRAREWLAKHPRRFRGSKMEPLQAFILESAATEDAGLARTRRTRALVRALLGLLFVGIAYTVWSNRVYLKVRIVTLPDLLWPKVLSAEQAGAKKPKDTFQECAICPKMIVVPAGKFSMGSSDSQAYPDEKPVHEVSIPTNFAVSMYEATFDEWEACVALGGCSPVGDAGWERGTRPVINVFWDQAQEYVAWLNKQTRTQGYRLLSEAEWEYAARADTTTAYSFDQAMIDQYAWYSDNSGGETHSVGKKERNAFGLYDMHGNVWEWVRDCYHENYQGAPEHGSAWTSGDCTKHVARGGSWSDGAQTLRSSHRTWLVRPNAFGFRVARTLIP